MTSPYSMVTSGNKPDLGVIPRFCKATKAKGPCL